MDELLREFAQYTPAALLRIIADGATAILLLMPNLIGLALYALLVGWVVEKVISSISATLRHVRIRQLVRNRRTPLGTARARVATWLPMVAEKLVQAWTGLPVLYVLSLTLSHDSAAAGQLRRLVSGYRWQEGALAKLPLKTWLDSSHSSVWQVVLSVAVALLYANNSYLYFANGF